MALKDQKKNPEEKQGFGAYETDVATGFRDQGSNKSLGSDLTKNNGNHNDDTKSDPEEFLILLPKRFYNQGLELLKQMSENPAISWDAHGELTIRNKTIKGSDLKHLLPIIFSGTRKGRNIGEQDIIDFLQEEDLESYIGSVSSVDWFYIGVPNTHIENDGK